jgi:hypothetical protein
VPEREERLDPLRVVVAVAREEVLAVDHAAVLAGVVQERGRVLDALREGLRQAARGVHVAEQHVGERVARLLAGVPHLHDRRDAREPVHADRRARVHHHDRARVRGRDLLDQLDLAAGQLEVRAIVALALPLVVQPHDHDRGVGFGRGALGALHHVGRQRRHAADLEPAEQRAPLVRELDGELDGAAGLEAHVGRHLGAAQPEERLAGRLRGPVVDDERAVEEQPALARRDQRERERARLARGDVAGRATQNAAGSTSGAKLPSQAK